MECISPESTKRSAFKGFQTLRKALELALGKEAVQEFLQNMANQEQTVLSFQVTAKGLDEWIFLFYLKPPENQRPHRCINDEIHDRGDQSCNPNLCETQTSRTHVGCYAVAAVG